MARLTLGDRLTALVNDENLDSRSRKFAGDLLSHYLRKKSLTPGRRVWVDKLETRAAEAAATPAGEVPAEFVTLRERIHAADGESSWAGGFIDSVTEQVRRGRTLSEKQRAIVERMKDDYLNDAWEVEYVSNYRASAKLLAAYYVSAGLPYHREMVARINRKDDYVPRRGKFLKMYNNRYAQRVLEQVALAPAFAVQSRVQLRKNQTTRAKYRNHIGKKAFILAVGSVVEAVKGGRSYTVLFAGDPRPIEVQERYLMKAR